MSLFLIDQEKCLRCGTCAEVCPVKAIAVQEGSAPVPTAWAEQGCINCGHCVAVCPQGAFSLKRMPVSQCPPIEQALVPNEKQLGQFLRSRRSIRAYEGKAVAKGIIESVIDIACYAPTGMNSQPVHWKVIYDSSEVVRLKDMVIEWMRCFVKEKHDLAKAFNFKHLLTACDSGIDIILRDAPHVIIAHAPKGDPIAQSSCIIALTYLELAAKPFSLGTCWAGFLDAGLAYWTPLQDVLELPEGHVSYSSVMIGYPKHRYHRIPLRNRAKVTWR